MLTLVSFQIFFEKNSDYKFVYTQQIWRQTPKLSRGSILYYIVRYQAMSSSVRSTVAVIVYQPCSAFQILSILAPSTCPASMQLIFKSALGSIFLLELHTIPWHVLLSVSTECVLSAGEMLRSSLPRSNEFWKAFPSLSNCHLYYLNPATVLYCSLSTWFE